MKFSTSRCRIHKKQKGLYLLQEVLKKSVELIYKLIEQLGAGDIHTVVDGKLLVAEIVVGGGAGFKDLSVCVLILDFPDLSQQGI